VCISIINDFTKYSEIKIAYVAKKEDEKIFAVEYFSIILQ